MKLSTEDKKICREFAWAKFGKLPRIYFKSSGRMVHFWRHDRNQNTDLGWYDIDNIWDNIDGMPK